MIDCLQLEVGNGCLEESVPVIDPVGQSLHSVRRIHGCCESAISMVIRAECRVRRGCFSRHLLDVVMVPELTLAYGTMPYRLLSRQATFFPRVLLLIFVFYKIRWVYSRKSSELYLLRAVTLECDFYVCWLDMTLAAVCCSCYLQARARHTRPNTYFQKTVFSNVLLWFMMCCIVHFLYTFLPRKSTYTNSPPP